MVKMKVLALIVAVTLCLLSPSSGRTQALSLDRSDESRASLFAQSAGQVLNREFPSDDISFLLLDVHTGTLLASRWAGAETPIPLGSLVKPFTALAYGERHEFQYPAHICRGTKTGCWRPSGHGVVDLTSAIAYSCNSYFRLLTKNLASTDLSQIVTRFGLQPPPPGTDGSALAGFGGAWRISPFQMAHAYLELIRHQDEPGVRPILSGMAQSARQGTAAGVDRALAHSDALAKTGTAPCTHSKHAPGDGFTVVLIPADLPQFLLLVRVHGVPGAEAAKTAGEMLHRLEP
jgi:hypothetical protein